MSDIQLKITVVIPDSAVVDLLGLDPAVELDRPVHVQIGNWNGTAYVAGYVATNGRASITICAMRPE